MSDASSGCLPRQVPGHVAGRRSRGRDRGRPAARRFRRRRRAAARRRRRGNARHAARGTRRFASRRARHRTARRSGRRRSGVCCPGGIAIIEMARASGLALVSGRNDPLRASTRGTGELIAVARRAGFQAGDRRRGRKRDDRRRTRRGRGARLVVAGHRSHGRVRRRVGVPRRGHDVRTAEGRVARRRSRC